VQPSSERAQAEVDVDAHAQGRVPTRCRSGLDQIEVLARVDHDREARLGALSAQATESGQGRAIGGRVGDKQVVEAVAREPQRLRKGEAERAAKAGCALEHRGLERAAAHGLAGEADGLRPRPASEIGGVRPEGAQIDAGERGIDVRAGSLEPFELARRGSGFIRARARVGLHACHAGDLTPRLLGATTNGHGRLAGSRGTPPPPI
jgi:hypothetical protein